MHVSPTYNEGMRLNKGLATARKCSEGYTIVRSRWVMGMVGETMSLRVPVPWDGFMGKLRLPIAYCCRVRKKFMPRIDSFENQSVTEFQDSERRTVACLMLVMGTVWES